MAKALGWDRVASFYIDLEALVPPSGIPKPRAASDASARRSHAICDYLVFAGRLAADHVCRLAARPYACPFLMSASGTFGVKPMRMTLNGHCQGPWSNLMAIEVFSAGPNA